MSGTNNRTAGRPQARPNLAHRYDPFVIQLNREGKAVGFFSPQYSTADLTERVHDKVARRRESENNKNAIFKRRTSIQEKAVGKKPSDTFFEHPFDIPLIPMPETVKKQNPHIQSNEGQNARGRIAEAWRLWGESFSSGLTPVTTTVPNTTKPSTPRELAAVSRLYDLRGCRSLKQTLEMSAKKNQPPRPPPAPAPRAASAIPMNDGRSRTGPAPTPPPLCPKIVEIRSRTSLRER